MKFRKIQWLFGVACCAALSTVSVQAANLSENVVKIGVLSDMSGPYSDVGGMASVNTVQMAIEDFKAAHNPDFKVEVVYADHQNKADIAGTKAREWFDVQGVDMVTDLVNSAAGLAVSKAAAERKRVVMNTGTASMRLTNEDCNPYTVAWVFDTYSLANVTARAVVKNGGNTWAFLTADYTFGHSLEKDASDVVKEMGGQVLGSVRHPLNTVDFSSFLLNLQSTGAKVIGFANAGSDAVNALKAAKEFGIMPKQKVVGLVTFLSDVHSLGLTTAQGTLIADGWYWDMNDETRAWARRFFDQNKKMPSMLYAGVYSATLSYLKAVQHAGTDDPDAVMSVLRSTPVNDMFAKNGHLREDGRMVHDMYLMQVKTPQESKYPWDYLKLVSTIPGDEAFQPLSKSRCPLVKK